MPTLKQLQALRQRREKLLRTTLYAQADRELVARLDKEEYDQERIELIARINIATRAIQRLLRRDPELSGHFFKVRILGRTFPSGISVTMQMSAILFRVSGEGADRQVTWKGSIPRDFFGEFFYLSSDEGRILHRTEKGPRHSNGQYAADMVNPGNYSYSNQTIQWIAESLERVQREMSEEVGT